MRPFQLGSLVSTAVAIAFGLIVLLGYFLDIPLIDGLQSLFLRWGVILAAAALLVGVVNLAGVHWRRANGYSIVLLISLAATIVIAGLYGPTAGVSLWIFSYIQVPVAASLLAILAVILVYTAGRLLSRRITVFSIIFLATALIILIGTAALQGGAPILDGRIPFLFQAQSWLQRIPAVAGARGILLGVALGTVAAGLRVFAGADRPYGG